MIIASAVALALTGNGQVRYSADHTDTIPFWHRWVPALIGIALVRLTPPQTSQLSTSEIRTRPASALRGQALVLLAAAVLFAVVLRLAGGGEPAHTLLKLPLLVGVPAVLFHLAKRPGEGAAGGDITRPWRRWGPAVPVVTWFALAYTGPFAVPNQNPFTGVDAVTVVATVVVVFVVNSVVEEVFYRRWLQTRWEVLLGPWPGIVLASLLWAVWHIGIQSTGSLPVDLASTAVNQGVTGLFLGYLWSRYRVMWPILTVHGAMNAAPVLVALL